MSKNSKDLLISITCIGFSLCFMLLAIPREIPLPKFVSGGTTPRAIPTICCWLILAMSALILTRTVMRDRRCFAVMAQELGISLKNKQGWRTLGFVLLVFAMSVLYYIGFVKIGFFITTLMLFPVYAYVLGCRKPIALIVTDLALTFGVYYFFAVFMSCYLPGWAPF
ncbi:MAG: tripartite tricarboxylate transporter TctB family protein [Oscillospiraceae bacterium]